MASSDLEWLLIRKYNSFMVKAVPEGPVLSREPGNLLNIHSHKYSGIANRKSVGIRPTSEDGGITIVTKRTTGSANTVAGSSRRTELKRSTTARRAAKIASGVTAGKGYRTDLQKAAIARASILIKAQHAKGSSKSKAPRAARGKKAQSAQQTKKADADDLD